MPVSDAVSSPSDADYERLLEFRTDLRRFLHWSEQQARDVGLTPAQHQLLLAIRGHRERAGPTIGEVAEMLLLRHHSAVELADRAEAAGFVTRVTDADDHRQVRLRLTASGAGRLARLSEQHLEELARLQQSLGALAVGLDDGRWPRSDRHRPR